MIKDKMKLTVLFVEDSKTSRESVKLILKDDVKKFYLASNGEEGFEFYLKYKPDIVLTDIEMPKMDGLSMAKKLKEIDEDIPIVVISGHAKDKLFIKAIKIGIKEFLFKPIDEKELKKTLKRISKYINHKREIEEQLKLAQNAMELSPISIWMVDSYGKLIYANQALLKNLNYTLEELKELRIDDIDKNHTPKKIIENLHYIKKNGHLKFETILTRKDKTTFNAEFSINHLDYLGDDIYCAFVQDVTVRKEQNTLLNKKSEKLIELATLLEEKIDTEIKKGLEKEILLSSIFSNTKFGMCLIDENKKFLKINRAFCKIFAYQEDELINKDLTKLLSDNTKLNLKEFYESDFYETQNMNGYDWIGKRKDNKEINIDIVKSKIENLTLELLIITDITHIKKIKEERYKQEQMLIQQSKMASMGEMIGAIAHQWKQPLNVLAGNLVNLEIAMEFDELKEDEIKECINHSNSQIQFMAHTIDDFRNFFRPTKEKSIFNIKEAIEKIIELLMPQFKNNAIKVEIKSENDMNLEILGFANEFKQVILNIINNSRDAILEKRIKSREKSKFYEEIVINLSQKDNKSIIAICDNGGGIREDMLAKIFEPYTTTKGSKGTGIGLHLSKTIIENNFNGTLYALNSSCVNNDTGAKFIIEVPNAKN